MVVSFKTVFLFIACVFIINLSIAGPPTQYNELKNVSVGEGLNGVFYINDTASNYNVWNCGANICIRNNVEHKTGVTIKVKANSLYAKNGGSNSIMIQHENDIGIIDNVRVINIGTPDVQGFVYLMDIDFSTIIIGGVTSTYNQSETGLSNGSVVYFNDLNVTGNITLNGINTIAHYNLYGNIFKNVSAIFISTNGSDVPIGYSKLLYIPWQVNMQPDMDDLNFTSSSGNLLSYKRENVTNNSHAWVWVNLSDPIVNSSDTIYMYYGNEDLSDGSNASNTFLFAEYFDEQTPGSAPNGWSYLNTSENGNIVIDNTTYYGDNGNSLKLETTNASSYAQIYKDTNVESTDGSIKASYKMMAYETNDRTDTALSRQDLGTTYSFVNFDTDGKIYTLTNSFAYSSGTWYDIEVLLNTTSNKRSVWVDGVLKENQIAYTPYTNLTFLLFPYWTVDNKFWIDNIRIRKHIDNEPTYQINASTNNETTIYFIPTGHPTSENTTLNESTFVINSTVTEGVPLSEITIYCTNNCTFNGTFTFNVIGNYTLIDETHTGGYQTINLNFTSTLDFEQINLSVNFTDYNDFLTDIANITATNGSISCIGFNCSLTSTNYINNTVFSSSLSFRYFNAPVVTAPVIGTTTINVSSTTFPGVTGYFFRYAVNGTTNYSYVNVTTANTQLTNLTVMESYDIWVRVNKSGGDFSDYSDMITISTSSGDEAIDALLVQIEANHQETLAEIEEARTEINALWGGFIIFAILVISWIRQKLNTSNYKNEV